VRLLKAAEYPPGTELHYSIKGQKDMERFLQGRWMFLMLLLALALPYQVVAQTSKRDKTWIASERAALDMIATVAKDTNRVVVVEFRGYGTFMLPPPIHIQKKTPEADAEKTLRLMLKNDKRFRIKTDPDGVVRVFEPGIPNDVLNIRVKRVKLSEEQRFNDKDAMGAVLQAPEVQTYFEAHNIEQPIDLGGFINPSDPRLPHLETAIENMTVLDALKHILLVFGETGVYKDAKDTRGRRVVSISFCAAN
jgi:hypothetical protein